jgi:GNAT superfamily N-acetyltransferase
MYTIEAAAVSDSKLIVQFQISMALETEDLVLSGETVEKGVKAIFEDPGKGTYYVAKRQGDIVACLLTTPEWSEWRNGTVLWIQSVYVLPAHRGSGIFRKLYEYVQLQVTETESLRGIRLYVDNRNEAAQKVYHALGMDNQHYQLFEWMKS